MSTKLALLCSMSEIHSYSWPNYRYRLNIEIRGMDQKRWQRPRNMQLVLVTKKSELKFSRATQRTRTTVAQIDAQIAVLQAKKDAIVAFKAKVVAEVVK